MKSGDDGFPPNRARELSDLLGKAIEGMEFDSFEELQAFTDEFVARRQKGPLSDFQGLSPVQMHALLYFPFESPDIVVFSESVDTDPVAPAATLFRLLADALGEKGIKATAKGYLPRQTCRDIAQGYWGPERYLEETKYGPIDREARFPDLIALRHTATLAGLMKYRSGRFSLTRKGEQMLERDGLRSIYPLLLRTYVRKFNWAFRDNYPDLDIVQLSFGFTLYLLVRNGSSPRPASYYQNAFLRAYPDAVHEVDDGLYRTAEQIVGSCFKMRALVRFAYFFGLVHIEGNERGWVLQDSVVTKAPLLDEVVRFPSSTTNVPNA